MLSEIKLEAVERDESAVMHPAPTGDQRIPLCRFPHDAVTKKRD